ncbi:MAG: ATP-binding protein [Desulfobacterales bacterium]|jgi:signal transduction histidine kinase|nr:ATP-binding protein [Desulfobacterales bacterium]
MNLSHFFHQPAGDRHPVPGGLALTEQERELLDRPAFSFRFQIILGFLIVFLLSVAIIIGAMVAVNHIQRRITTFQTWQRFLFDVEQARRWEKNFFLYGTNLQEALESSHEAQRLLEANLEALEAISGPQGREAIAGHLAKYHALLQDLYRLVQAGTLSSRVQDELETNLRHYGALVVEDAADVAARENQLVLSWLDLMQKVPTYYLVFHFVLMLWMTRFLSNRFMKPLNYLVKQTKRIATGDFSDVKPIRKYRDEFTTVEVAINRMLRELESRQNSLIDSHKLRAVGILTAGVAHELNNPLNNIMLTAHAILEEYQALSAEETVAMVKDIVAETDRSRAIVHNLLDFTRETESVMGPLQLGRLLEETIRLARNQVKVKRAILESLIAPDLPQVHGDRQQLKQAFLNLILNALDAIGEEGIIRVTAAPAAPGVLQVQIEDNGCGIPADALTHVFDPFYTTKPVGKGTGLGLSVVHGIVTKHGGDVTVKSAPGHTVFTVTLPCRAPVAAPLDPAGRQEGHRT